MSSNIDYNAGQFRATLQLMASCGDNELKKHMQKSSHSNYISPQSQNELIEIIATVMANKIVEEVKANKFFTILADETQDSSGQEQLSLCVRYINSSGDVQERFVCFEIVKDMTGKGISTAIMKILANFGFQGVAVFPS